MTQAGVGVDDNHGVRVQDRHHGRHGLRPRSPSPTNCVLYLFGTPGPGAVLVPVERPVRRGPGRGRPGRHARLEVSFDVMGRLEERGVPFVVAVNTFPGRAPVPPSRNCEPRSTCPRRSPSSSCDVRRRASSRDVLLDPDALPARPRHEGRAHLSRAPTHTRRDHHACIARSETGRLERHSPDRTGEPLLEPPPGCPAHGLGPGGLLRRCTRRTTWRGCTRRCANSTGRWRPRCSTTTYRCGWSSGRREPRTW